jgi:hypothetical protein
MALIPGNEKEIEEEIKKAVLALIFHEKAEKVLAKPI